MAEKDQELAARVRAAAARSRELAERAGRVAEHSAAVEDNFADVHEGLAGQGVDPELNQRRADEARSFAAHERAEAQRLSALAARDPDDEEPSS